MAANRWQIGIGAVVLLLMLLVGAFSMGVYVGRHGWTDEGLTYAPVQGQGAQQPAGRNPPDLTGRIRRIFPQRLDLATPDGPRQVELAQDVQILDQDGQPLGMPDLTIGAVVAIFGQFTPGDGGHLVANTIILLPEQAPAAP
jgi:hypothetical protein